MKHQKRFVLLVSVLLLFVCVWYAFTHVQSEKSAMPVIVLDPGEGASFYEKDYHTATVSIDYPGQMKTIERSANARQRGNGTLAYDKKSYKIKLDEKADLLNEASETIDTAARDWVLLADYYDRSNLRNYYMFQIAAQLESFSFVPQGMFVELYVVNEFGEQEYMGVYLLCQQVEVDQARINIDDEIADEKGFLLELVQDHAKKQDYHLRVMHGDVEQVYDVRSNIDRETEDEALARMQQILENVETALATGDKAQIEAVIDLDSCVDMYLLQEYMMNIDVGWASFYLYCEAGEEKIYFGPPWDFDHSAGMDRRLYGGSYEGWYVGNPDANMMQQNLWYVSLMQQTWFQQLVVARWNEQKDGFYDAILEIDAVSVQYADLLQANYVLWRNETELDVIDMPFRGETYAEDAAYLVTWLKNRHTWLDEYYNTLL